jgi:hypothetical protein
MSCDCNTLVVGEAGPQGPQGLAGINGTNGVNGINAFTTTSANFTQPNVGAAVTIYVVDSRWIAAGQTLYISGAGFYRVTVVGVSANYNITATLLQTDGISPAGTVPTGRKVSPSSSAVYSAPLSSLTVTTGGVSILDGPVTINESGNNADVRIEGYGDTHLLYCDANAGTTGRVGISTNAPETTLHVDGAFKVGTAATPADALFTKGAIFNSEQSGSGTAGDFLIKTKNVSDTFFVDASADFVGIGTNTPSRLLDVDGAAEMNSLLVNPGGVAANPSFQVYGTNSTRPITVLSTSAPFNGVGIFKTTPTVALDVVGAATVTGATILGSTLTVAGDLSVDTNVLKVDTANNRIGVNKTSPAVALDVVGAATVTGATTLSSTLNVTGATTLISTLDVTGAATLNSTLDVTGAALLSSSLEVAGDLFVTSGVLAVDTTNSFVGINNLSPTVALDVVGATTLSSTLDVTGAATLSSTLAVTGNLSVDTNVLKVDVTGNFVGINKTTPTVALDVVGAISRGSPVTKTADFNIAPTENWIIVNNAGGATTVTLPSAASTPGREIFIKTIQAQVVDSASNNIVPLVGGSPAASILLGVAGTWATLVSDGSNWVIMAGT